MLAVVKSCCYDAQSESTFLFSPPPLAVGVRTPCGLCLRKKKKSQHARIRALHCAVLFLQENASRISNVAHTPAAESKREREREFRIPLHSMAGARIIESTLLSLNGCDKLLHRAAAGCRQDRRRTQGTGALSGDSSGRTTARKLQIKQEQFSESSRRKKKRNRRPTRTTTRIPSQLYAVNS